jgi:hypothetical protein
MAPLRCIALQGMPGKCGMCGGMGQPCCGGGGGGASCQGDLRCNDGMPGTAPTCQPCGARNEICCANSTCDMGSGCNDPGPGPGMCTACGGNNAACCPGDNCQAGFRCTAGTGGGASTCRPCGGRGEICCAGNDCEGNLTCRLPAGVDGGQTARRCE